jgi:uncharacterized membrane protein
MSRKKLIFNKDGGAFMSIKQSLFTLIAFIFMGCGGAEHGQTNSPGDGVEGEEGEIALSFAKDILHIIEARCSRCHNESASIPNWLDYEVIFPKREKVRLRAFENESMPPGNVTGITAEERLKIATWVDQGALP